MNTDTDKLETPVLTMDDVLARIAESLVTTQLKQDHDRLVDELSQAKAMILAQQQTILESERRNLLLQMTGVAEGNPIACIAQRIERLQEDKAEAAGKISPTISIEQELMILIVDKSIQYFQQLRSVLPDNANLTLVHARSQTEGLQALQESEFNIILLDHLLDDGDSFSFLEAINQAAINLPVVVITGKGDELLASQIIQAGAYDYLPKHCVNRGSLSRSINNALEKSRLRHENELVIKKIHEMATRDDLTSLHNRRYFMEILKREVARARRFGSELTLCMIDLDDFKRINDTFGHLVGDKVLADFAGILQDLIRDSDLACRYGGEEFVLILPNTSARVTREICQHICTQIADHQFEHASIRFSLTVSIGIATYLESTNQTPGELVALADQAMYESKRNGRNRLTELSAPAGAVR
jgi:two-component system cell cycle response regulator